MQRFAILFLAACSAAASAQTAFLWSEISTDGLHWHNAWWRTSHLTQYIRVRASWNNVSSGMGFASSQFNVCLANAVPANVTDLAIPYPLNALGQVLGPQDAGGRLCIINTAGADTWINPVQAAPLNNPGFTSAMPITLVTAVLPPSPTNYLSVSLFLNSLPGRALQVYTSPQGGVTRISGSAASFENASFFAASPGCIFMDLPETQTAVANTPVIFTATFGRPGNYQWRKNRVRLDETPDITGTRTIRLTFANAKLEDAGEYDCVVSESNCAQEFTSPPAILTISCPADFNNDFAIDFFDYIDFVIAFAATDMLSDFNHDSFIDFFDYLDFVQAYSAGC